MKKLILGLSVCGLLAMTALSANAKAPRFLSRLVAYQPPPAPTGVPLEPTPLELSAPATLPAPAPGVIQYERPVVPMIQLYHCVEYEDLKHIHPCAVPKIIRVADPRPVRRDACSTCKPQPRFVFVKIMVPPHCRPKIKVSRHGTKVKYDYGKYDIEIKSKKGIVYVEYDD